MMGDGRPAKFGKVFCKDVDKQDVRQVVCKRLEILYNYTQAETCSQ